MLSPEELEAHKTCVAIQMRQGVAETSSWRLPRTRWECAPPGITVAPPAGVDLGDLECEWLPSSLPDLAPCAASLTGAEPLVTRADRDHGAGVREVVRDDVREVPREPRETLPVAAISVVACSVRPRWNVDTDAVGGGSKREGWGRTGRALEARRTHPVSVANRAPHRNSPVFSAYPVIPGPSDRDGFFLATSPPSTRTSPTLNDTYSVPCAQLNDGRPFTPPRGTQPLSPIGRNLAIVRRAANRRSPADLLLRPVPITALLLLVLNDRVLKPTSPGWFTGKFSDAAGLVFTPLLLLAILEVLRAIAHRPWQPRRLSAYASVGLVVVVFVLVKLAEPVGNLYGDFLGLLRSPFLGSWRTVTITHDPTDLVVLPAASVALFEALAATRRPTFA